MYEYGGFVIPYVPSRLIFSCTISNSCRVKSCPPFIDDEYARSTDCPGDALTKESGELEFLPDEQLSLETGETVTDVEPEIDKCIGHSRNRMVIIEKTKIQATLFRGVAELLWG